MPPLPVEGIGIAALEVPSLVKAGSGGIYQVNKPNKPCAVKNSAVQTHELTVPPLETVITMSVLG